MEITNARVLDRFAARHRDADPAIRRWRRRIEHANWSTPYDVRLQTSDATILRNGRLIFNIRGNQYRLVAKVDYVAGTLDVRFIGNHARYDKVNAEEV